MDIEKNNLLVLLFDEYKNLLTKKQVRYLDMYLNNDISITEIAEIDKISRAAVFDAINKSIKKLYDFEKKLNNLTKKEDIKNYLKDINIEKKYKEEILKRL